MCDFPLNSSFDDGVKVKGVTGNDESESPFEHLGFVSPNPTTNP